MPTDAVRQDDPNVKIPAAVKASAVRASEIHSQVYRKSDDAPKDPPKDPPSAETPPTDATPPKEPTSSETPLPDAPVTAVTQKSNDPPKDTNWEHAYKSMKGRYEQTQTAVRSQSDRITQLENMIASLQAQTPSPAPRPADTDPASLITEKDVNDFGGEFLDVVGKKARQVVGQDIAEVRKQLDDMHRKLAGVGQTVTKNARETMKETLTATIPNWEQINLDNDFFAWLALQDPLSGAIRHNLLKDAWGRNDTARVSAFFKGFLAEQATGTPQSEQPDPTTGLAPGKVPLETLAAPGRAKTAADTGSPAEKPIITPLQISAFYRDKAAQKYRGREKEADAFEQQIFAAQREGRIR